MTKNAYYWIEKLNLQQHPEGGCFREIYRSEETIKQHALPERFDGDRSIATSIYFLLRSSEISAFHRIRSDELWHFYTGSSLTIHVINRAGDYSQVHLGRDFEKVEVFQAAIKRGVWFGATVNDPETFTLVGCTVAPGFDFHDFEMGERDKLIEKYPKHREIIEKLTHS